ncbi:hypothetical protein PHYSODRAFT_312095 [Phytophthora sojae]|uniref:Uncharacterized protein n=1 Tax=Phytophthora sojae (strain P6497) TaxID=1094619 RepID=G4YZL9_PHYSP|nr:hypothetical protein PHYSODRAFT_312095 [Phytophthora sojae]EGZ25787.1 hypothetical protein PHYSODRAFT_312095 [Phytophthora sojae]|eukprot:XP_009521075.1 hypothetical protein PHYSODRAFT_312095 [Phytophthora sojae]
MAPRPSFSFTEALNATSSSSSSSWENTLLLPESSEDSSGADQDQGHDWLQNKPQTQDAAAPSRKRSKPELCTNDKKRKMTYDVRREQKVELTAQVEKLQKQLDELKYQVLVEQGEAAKSNERAAAGNVVLQEVIQEQHLELASLQAMIAGHQQQNSGLVQPAHTLIRLGTDRTERHNTLAALKKCKLREAKRFITARSQGLDPRSTYNQENRNNSPGQDFCLTIFENRAIHGATARKVFDAFIDVAQNAEIVISEMFGSITIREDNEADTRDISQMRLVTSTSKGTMVESNTVMFAEFVEAKDDSEESCGVIVADFVDSDELYPFKPKERARRDTTTVFMIRSFMLPVADSESACEIKGKSKTSQKKELVVVGSRWSCSKIRRSEMNLSADAMRELQESTVSFGDTMKKCIQQRLGKKRVFEPAGNPRTAAMTRNISRRDNHLR